MKGYQEAKEQKKKVVFHSPNRPRKTFFRTRSTTPGRIRSFGGHQ